MRAGASGYCQVVAAARQLCWAALYGLTCCSCVIATRPDLC
jgi:hypothetical protein